MTSRNFQTQLGAKSDNKRQVMQKSFKRPGKYFCKTNKQMNKELRSNYKMMTLHGTWMGGKKEFGSLSEREVAKIF